MMITHIENMAACQQNNYRKEVYKNGQKNIKRLVMLINQLLKSVSNYQIKNDDDLLIQYVNPSID